MSPTTHLLASWILAAKTTDNPRDCRLVTLAGVLPDLDGLGLVVDIFNGAVRHKTTGYYQQYHHYWTHGLPGAIVITAVLVCFARRRGRVAVLALLAYHLHLLCDYVGSRGPDPADKWPIYYFGPLSQNPVWFCKWQWPLFGWQNGVISIVLFVWAMAMTMNRGDSFIGVFNRRADAIFVAMLRKWRDAFRVAFEGRP
jgi:inner membrane protein